MPAEFQILGKKLRAMRKRLLKSQQQMAALSDLSLSGYRRIEYEEQTGIQIGTLQAMARGVEMTGSDLLAEIGANGRSAPAIVGEVTAGDMVEMFTDDSELEHVPMTFPENPKAFALRIRGDSMEPEYQSGDVIVVEPVAADKIQPGDDLVVWCDGANDGKSCFKRVERIKGGKLYMRPLNRKHEPFEVKCEHVVRAAIEIGLYRAKRRA